MDLGGQVFEKLTKNIEEFVEGIPQYFL